MTALSRHGTDELKPYISHIVDVLTDTDERVRCAAIKTMGDLPQNVVEEHSSAICKCTTQPSEEMKAASREVLVKLQRLTAMRAQASAKRELKELCSQKMSMIDVQALQGALRRATEAGLEQTKLGCCRKEAEAS